MGRTSSRRTQGQRSQHARSGQPQVSLRQDQIGVAFFFPIRKKKEEEEKKKTAKETNTKSCNCPLIAQDDSTIENSCKLIQR